MVGVDEAPAEALSQDRAKVDFASTHEANQDDALEAAVWAAPAA